METTRTWQIDGMHCSSCSILIDEAVEELDGVASSSTSLKKKLTTVTFDATRCNVDQIVATIIEAGYRAAPAGEQARKKRGSWFRRAKA